eukprot:scaffold3190_cov121-Skeletonema_menzelii.AAC.4
MMMIIARKKSDLEWVLLLTIQTYYDGNDDESGWVNQVNQVNPRLKGDVRVTGKGGRFPYAFNLLEYNSVVM